MGSNGDAMPAQSQSHNHDPGPASPVRSRALEVLRACAQHDLEKLLERWHGLGGADWSEARAKIRKCLDDLERT